MNPDRVKIDQSWKNVLRQEFEKEYFEKIKEELVRKKNQGKVIYPKGPHIFRAFDLTPFDQLKVVILGQDPYHGPGEAMGLCFSVPKAKRIPPSLRNIYKEIDRDLGYSVPSHGDLTCWAEQGVLLINSVLTVDHKSPGSHKNIGWEMFTDAVITQINELKTKVVFLLWGRFAQSKVSLIDQKRHFVLQAFHPSPLAGNRFIGCGHFSKCNELLKEHGIEEINWQVQ